MRHVVFGGLTAAALGTALIVAGAFPASAQVARFQPALANGADGGELLTLVRERSGGGGGGGGGGGADRGGGGGGGGADRGGGGRADRGGSGGGDGVVRIERSGGERSVSRDRNRGEIAGRSDTSRVTRVVRDRDGKRRRVIVHRRHHRDGDGFGLGFSSYAGYRGYCMSQFQAYDPVSGLYLSYDGLWYSCP